MKTLEERAKTFAETKSNCDRCRFCYDYKDSTCDKYNKYVSLYKEIADEQKVNDKEEFCEWIMRTPMYAKQPTTLVDEFLSTMKNE